MKNVGSDPTPENHEALSPDSIMNPQVAVVH